MSENSIQVHHAPLETPEQIGRVERHGGLVKAMFRKVSAETKPTNLTEVQSCLDEVTRVNVTVANSLCKTKKRSVLTFQTTLVR